MKVVLTALHVRFAKSDCGLMPIFVDGTLIPRNIAFTLAALAAVWSGMGSSAVGQFFDIHPPLIRQASPEESNRRQIEAQGPIQASALVESDARYDPQAERESTIEIPSEMRLDSLRDVDGRESGFVQEMEQLPRRSRFNIYRQSGAIMSWMPGDGNQFGWIDFESTPYIKGTKRSGITTAIGLHLLSGPNVVPLPPRLWDFVLGYQTRQSIADCFSYDLAANIGVYSDFEDSARDGVRTLGHAVGMLHANESLDLVAGVDYLDRDDYKILPVIGYSWHRPDWPNLQVDMVFPRPRVGLALDGSNRVYVAGLLGGGTWAIEMPDSSSNVMTYRDFRLLFGHEQLTSDGSVSAIELGWVFGRKVEFRSEFPEYDFNDAFILRFVSSH
jgi:hypothetical protein